MSLPQSIGMDNVTKPGGIVMLLWKSDRGDLIAGNDSPRFAGGTVAKADGNHGVAPKVVLTEGGLSRYGRRSSPVRRNVHR